MQLQPDKHPDSMVSSPPVKKLVLRLSSLGDVVLATAVLQTPHAAKIDWLVAHEFAPILRGHPQIEKLWEFNRKDGLISWISLCRKISSQNYDEIWDLHSTIRTSILRAILFFSQVFDSSRSPTRWKKFKKERWKLYGLIAAKRFWPRVWMPRPFVQRFALFSGGTGAERPQLSHMTAAVGPGGVPGFTNPSKSYYCVMPGSKWQGKRWDPSRFAEVISQVPGTAIILGSNQDSEAFELVNLLKQKGLAYFSGVGLWNLSEVAYVLAHSCGYFGNDTGLAHLAEAVGVPALMVFGPTSPEMGFGPWRGQSGIAQSPVCCRPCGKDGRRCYRICDRYLCMSSIDTRQVTESLKIMLENPT